jgi:L-seryl-tRNA(Ser) seleniumtransferase
MDPSDQVKSDPRRALPSADRLISAVTSVARGLPRWCVVEGVREVLAQERERLGGPNAGRRALAHSALTGRALSVAEALARPRPFSVVNATGIVLHTNLGRAPLATGAAEAVAQVAATYGDLELDLESGRRGNRLSAISRKLELLSGAEAAFAVNNNAGALFLALNSLARGREVIVSRGELVEIGGSFRVPDIMERAGARLVEVGTTNRTHPEDYVRAIGPDTALLLKVHSSNFEIRGFVTEVSLGSLAEIGRDHGLPVVEDLGSGTFVDLSARGYPSEADARTRLAAGADVVCFSGDKLLGGPQAGIVLGDRERLDAMKRNPAARALRLDKLSIAALDWTLEAYLDGRAEREIPVLRQLLARPSDLEQRARGLAARLTKLSTALEVEAAPDRAFVGGGSLPGLELDTWVVRLRGAPGAEEIAKRLRQASLPVLARVRDDAVVLDVRTLLADDEARIETALAEALPGAAR